MRAEARRLESQSSERLDEVASQHQMRVSTRIQVKPMTVLQKRSQLVAFRVSAEEYGTLLKSCVESGARSVADFARAAVLQRAQVIDSQAGTLHGDLTTVARTLAELDTTLDLVRKRIRDVLGPARDLPHVPSVVGLSEFDGRDDQFKDLKE